MPLENSTVIQILHRHHPIGETRQRILVKIFPAAVGIDPRQTVRDPATNRSLIAP